MNIATDFLIWVYSTAGDETEMCQMKYIAIKQTSDSCQSRLYCDVKLAVGTSWLCYSGLQNYTYSIYRIDKTHK